MSQQEREIYAIDLTVDELAAVQDFLRIRRQLSDEDGSATFYTAQALAQFEKSATQN